MHSHTLGFQLRLGTGPASCFQPQALLSPAPPGWPGLWRVPLTGCGLGLGTSGRSLSHLSREGGSVSRKSGGQLGTNSPRRGSRSAMGSDFCPTEEGAGRQMGARTAGGLGKMGDGEGKEGRLSRRPFIPLRPKSLWPGHVSLGLEGPAT